MKALLQRRRNFRVTKNVCGESAFSFIYGQSTDNIGEIKGIWAIFDQHFTTVNKGLIKGKKNQML